MDEETPASNLSMPKEEEVTETSKASDVPANESTEAADSVSPDQTEENVDDLHSEKSNSGCSDHSGEETDDASVVLEREEGDGQEEAPNRKVDDDEDKRNPQYIPKRGTFYEHDDRTAVEEAGEEVENPEEERDKDKDAAAKKKVWSEKEASKWNHDRFNDTEQAPKSRSELIAIYGYDIRNEEGPPRARRRRRYGRGPNKYTRNWEDEEAYGKPTNVVVKPNPRKTRARTKQEEFPPLGGNRNHSKSSECSDNSILHDEPVESNINSEKPVHQNEEVEEQQQVEEPKHISESAPATNAPLRRPESSQENGEQRGPPRPQQQRREIGGRGGRNGPKLRQDESPRGPLNNSSRGITRSRGFRSSGGRGSESNRNRNQKNQQAQDDEYSDYIVSQNFTNKSMSQQQREMQELDKDMSNMNVQDANYNSSNRGGGDNRRVGQRQTSVPPRLQGEQRGSKRYSSLRQRSLPETAPPTFGQHSGYYPPEFGQQNPPPPNQQGLLPHPNPSIHSQVPTNNTQQMITVAPTNQTIGALSHQVPSTNGAPPIIQGPPPQFAQPYPQAPPAFLQPGVAPAAFLPQQPPPPQLINYAAPPPQFPPPPNYNNFPHQQFTPVPVNPAPPTAELYQPQGGITYYSTQNQQLVPRIPPKRRTAAIPIVPPPEHKEPRGRGRLNQGEDSPVGNTPDLVHETYIEQDNGMIMSYHPQDQLGEVPVVLQQ